MRTSCLLRSAIEEESKNYREALEYYKEYYSYTRKVFNSEKNNKLLELQKKYDFEKIRNSTSQLIIERQRMQISLILALLATGLMFLFFHLKDEKR